MDSFVAFEVGKPFPFPQGGYGYDGSVFQFDTSGYHMTIYLRGVAPREAEAIRSEAVYHFALTTVDSVLFVITRVVLPPNPGVGRFAERTVVESETPYSWHLVPALFRPTLEEIEALAQSPKSRALFQVTIVDSLSNIVQALRFVTPSAEFTSRFHSAVAQQARQPFNRADYDQHIASVRRKHTIKQLYRMASVRCVGGTSEEEKPAEKSQGTEQAKNPTPTDVDGKPKVIESEMAIALNNDYGLSGVMAHSPVLVPDGMSTDDLVTQVGLIETLDDLHAMIGTKALWIPFFEHAQLEHAEIVMAAFARIGSDTIKVLVVREPYYVNEFGLELLDLSDEVRRKASIAARLCGLR